ncbi:MAG: polyprenyl synthetase family protein [Planctomycetes bacterium]|nr:polyprenyl synthetase family protein [Planctomycetota bacterium]
MLELAPLYAPISEDLKRVDQVLRHELRSSISSVDALCRHVERYRGKMLRPAVLLLSGRACGNVRRAHDTLAAVVEMVHLATLVHDDVLDDSDIRRSCETVNRMWGTESAVLLGDYLFSHAFALCSSLESQFASQLIGKTASTLCEGELIQVSRRNDFTLSEETYFDIIARKTASLTRTCCTLGARYAGADPGVVAQLAQFGRSLGMAFQIADDLLDLTGDEQETGKTVGRDVCKGKITLPIIHFLREQPDGRRDEMLEILGGGQADTYRRVSELLNESDSIEYARDHARSHIAMAVESLSELPVSDARGALTAMAEFVLSRRG